MRKEKNTSGVEENKDEKRFEEENKLNNSTLTPNPTEAENSHSTAPQVERVERGNETTSEQVKPKFVSLKFPKVPKVKVANVDAKGPIFHEEQKKKSKKT